MCSYSNCVFVRPRSVMCFLRRKHIIEYIYIYIETYMDTDLRDSRFPGCNVNYTGLIGTARARFSVIESYPTPSSCTTRRRRRPPTIIFRTVHVRRSARLKRRRSRLHHLIAPYTRYTSAHVRDNYAYLFY